MAEKRKIDELDIIRRFDKGDPLAEIERCTGASRYKILKTLAERDGKKPLKVITAGKHTKNRVYLVLSDTFGIKAGDKVTVEQIKNGITLKLTK